MAAFQPASQIQISPAIDWVRTEGKLMLYSVAQFASERPADFLTRRSK